MKSVRPIIRLPFLMTSLLSLWPLATAQQLSREKIIESLEKDGCVTLEQSKVKICKYDYSSEGNTVEAVSFQPQAILLRDRLIELRKDFEIELFPNAKHDLPGTALASSINFFSRKLRGVPAKDIPKFR